MHYQGSLPCGIKITLPSPAACLSSIAAAIPIFVLLFLLGVKRKPAWIAALSGLAAAALVATFAYGMPADKLTGLGFSPFYAAGICLLANTAPVAFGSIGTPLVTLQAITKLPLDRLSAGVGRICAPVSLIVPAYLILVMGGWPALKGVAPAAALCGVVFAGTQIVVSNLVGPELTDILASLAAIGSLIALFKLWQPKDKFVLAGEHSTEAAASVDQE